MNQGLEAIGSSESADSPLKRTRRPGLSARSLSVRLTDEERSVLLAKAGGTPLGTYIRDAALGVAAQASRRRSRRPVGDQKALAQVLAAFGQSRIANNLNQLAKAVNIGALPVTPETESEIVEACAAVKAMRGLLLRALGLFEDGPA